MREYWGNNVKLIFWQFVHTDNPIVLSDADDDVCDGWKK